MNKQLGFSYTTPDTPEGELFKIQKGVPGKTILIIRQYAERFAGDVYPLIRINPFDFETDQPNHISIPLGAEESLMQIKDFIKGADYPF